MKEFGIMPCHICQKTPTINKDITKIGDNRYIISHCGSESKGHTETQAIYNWNKLQLDYLEDTDEE